MTTADLPGAFMLTETDKLVTMRRLGTTVELLLLRMAPLNERSVAIGGGQKVLWVLLVAVMARSLPAGGARCVRICRRLC